MCLCSLFVISTLHSLPQTWEDPTFVHPDAEGCKGDNDPVDVVEIGAKIVPTGVSAVFHADTPHSYEQKMSDIYISSSTGCKTGESSRNSDDDRRRRGRLEGRDNRCR